MTVTFQMFPTLSPFLPISPFLPSFLTYSFIHCSLDSFFFFSPSLSALVVGVASWSWALIINLLCGDFHLFLDTHNLFWMGLCRETQIELTTLFRSCWIPALVLKIKFQWLVSLEWSAKEFIIISVTRWRKFYSPVSRGKQCMRLGELLW